jgi:hypothetical protein
MNVNRWLLALFLLSAGLARGRQQDAPPPAQASPAPAQEEHQIIPVPLPQGTRLFLKDGNNLLVREYKTEGDRVRYWSVERSAWEEIPAALVDWEATHKGESGDAARKKQIDEDLAEIARRQRASSIDVDASLEVAPGVFLPDGVGMFVMASGGVASMSQAEAGSKRDKGRMIIKVLSPIPIVPSRQRVELKGAHAQLRVTDLQPEFYFRTADKREPAVVLVRAKAHGSSRLLSEISTLVTGQSNAKENSVLLERWTVAHGVFRFTLGEQLREGEYAFLERTEEEGLSLYVWDFGVDPPGGPAAAKK